MLSRDSIMLHLFSPTQALPKAVRQSRNLRVFVFYASTVIVAVPGPCCKIKLSVLTAVMASTDHDPDVQLKIVELQVFVSREKVPLCHVLGQASDSGSLQSRKPIYYVVRLREELTTCRKKHNYRCRSQYDPAGSLAFSMNSIS